jgi:hypothetical protein
MDKASPPPAWVWVAGTVVDLVVLYAAFYVLTYRWLYVPILKHLCRTMEISDLSAADAIAQSMEPAPRFGEGLADAFDVGVI